MDMYQEIIWRQKGFSVPKHIVHVAPHHFHNKEIIQSVCMCTTRHSGRDGWKPYSVTTKIVTKTLLDWIFSGLF